MKLRYNLFNNLFIIKINKIINNEKGKKIKFL